MEELLDPTILDMKEVYEREFVGMTTEPVSYEKLIAARKECVDQLRKNLDDGDKNFMISIMNHAPEWGALGIPNLEHLPSLQWKLQNVGKMNPMKRKSAIKTLLRVLGG